MKYIKFKENPIKLLSANPLSTKDKKNYNDKKKKIFNKLQKEIPKSRRCKSKKFRYLFKI